MKIHPINFLIVITVIVIGPIAKAGSTNVSVATDHYTFVIIHGATAGGWEWKPVGRFLTGDGHTVYRPTLTGLGERCHLSSPEIGLDTHIEDVVNLILFEDLHDIVLCAHSYGGMVATGVMNRIPERIHSVIFLDAFVPEDGESLHDITGHPEPESMVVDGMFSFPGTRESAKYPRNVPHPVKTFQQPVSFDNPAARSLPGTYIRFDPGKPEDPFNEPFLKSMQRAQARGWAIRTFPGHHVSHWQFPRQIASLVEECLAP